MKKKKIASGKKNQNSTKKPEKIKISSAKKAGTFERANEGTGTLEGLEKRKPAVTKKTT